MLVKHVFTSCCLALALLCSASIANSQSAPNILLLVAEDLSPRIGAWGDTVAQTPALDSLAEQSVRYTNVFTTAGVCAPSRAALIMGVHQISFGAQHMRSSSGPLGEYYAQPGPEMKAFPELLRRAGYFTFTDIKLDYQFSGIRAGTGPFTIWDAQGPQASWRQRADGQPFFGMINFLETHESGVMRMDTDPYSATHAATQRSRQTMNMVADTITDPADVVVPPYYPDIPEVRADMARHYDNIYAMDNRVGRILERLEADGLAENTIVLWTTDHGDGLPRAKRDLQDSGIHVPMIVYLPEAYQPADWRTDTVDERLISFVDLAPTILSWAGIDAPEHMHGQPINASERKYIFASRDRIDEVPDRQRAVRDQRYKYIRSWAPDTPGGHELAYRDNLEMVRAMRALWQQGQLNRDQARWFEPPGEEQLYDLQSDPYELNNLINEPSSAAVADRMSAALDSWLAATGDTSEQPEADMREEYLVDGEVPITPPPSLSQEAGLIRVEAQGGASVGYRIADGSWQLYVAPIRTPDQPVAFKAVRYGWRESAVVSPGPAESQESE